MKLPSGIGQKRPNCWRYNFRYRGKRYFYYRPTYEEILHLRNQIITDIGLDRFNENLYKGRLQEIITFEDYAIKWLEDLYERVDRKPTTKNDYRKRIKGNLIPFFGHFKLEEIGPNHINTYKTTHPKWSAKHLLNNLRVLSKILNDAKEVGLIEKMPKIEFPKAIEPKWDWLRLDEVDDFLDAVPPKHLILIKVLLRLGLRVGEAVALTKADIDFGIGAIRVDKSYFRGHVLPPKTRASNRWVPFDISLAHEFKEYVNNCTTNLLFPSARNKDIPLDPHHINRIVGKALKKAGIGRKLGAHSLRHSCASHLVLVGRPLTEVKAILGHSSIRMTEKYAHLSSKGLGEAIRKVGEALKMGTILGTTPRQKDQKDQVVGKRGSMAKPAKPMMRLVNTGND